MKNFKLLKASITSIFITVFCFSVYAQQTDTLRVMTYNLLNYRNNSVAGCSNTNNNPTTKETALRTIIDYTLPDVLICNEIGGSSSLNAFRILSNSLNQNGRSYYDFTNSTGIGQTLVNMIYFDSTKLKLHSQDEISRDVFNGPIVRIIDVYKLYYNNPSQLMNADTTFITIFGAHLKAGNTSTDRLQRERATQAVMAYLDSMNASGNYIMAGDLNLYRASENAYQNMLNYPDTNLRFYDPINVSGNWTNNTAFAITHTQSTRTSGGCGAGGGMDDRFDFLLVSDEILNSTDSVEYINNSYTALGQDGLRFNGSITSPTNNSVPTAVANALEDLSDHLPVYLDLKISIGGTTALKPQNTEIEVSFNNPVNESLEIHFSNNRMANGRLELVDANGKVLYAKNIFDYSYISINTSYLSKNIYFLRFIDKDGLTTVKKLIKI